MYSFHDSRQPHYHQWVDDGADTLCVECEQRGRKGFVVCCTPDGGRAVYHFSCLAESWLKVAKERPPLKDDFNCKDPS